MVAALSLVKNAPFRRCAMGRAGAGKVSFGPQCTCQGSVGPFRGCVALCNCANCAQPRSFIPFIVRLRCSVAPQLHGLFHVKLLMLLMLIGGVPREDQNGAHIRGEVHMLLVGDPGTGAEVWLGVGAVWQKVAVSQVNASGRSCEAVTAAPPSLLFCCALRSTGSAQLVESARQPGRLLCPHHILTSPCRQVAVHAGCLQAQPARGDDHR